MNQISQTQNGLNQFLVRYNPNSQNEICKDRVNCILGEYPTLYEINKLYGDKAASMWLVPQLYNLSEFCGAKEKLTKLQLFELVGLIIEDYGYLKISELMLFFRNFKKGYYGQFYGSIDPLLIMRGVSHFVDERNLLIFRIENQKRLLREELERKKTVTWEEYSRLKNSKKNK